MEAFYRQYIPALTDHLYEKGWTDISFQHVEDECISARERKEYLHMVNMFNELVPQEKMILFGDPIDTNNVDFMLERDHHAVPLSSIFDGSRGEIRPVDCAKSRHRHDVHLPQPPRATI